MILRGDVLETLSSRQHCCPTTLKYDWLKGKIQVSNSAIQIQNSDEEGPKLKLDLCRFREAVKS